MAKIKFANRSIRLPGSRVVRVGLGIALCCGGVLGFLPILGFWMIPLGVLVLSYDFRSVRRFRRRLEVRYGRRWKAMRRKNGG
jgi:purine-cytosine permease-like protein